MVWSVRTGRTSRTATVRIDRLTNDGTVLLAAISPNGRELAYVRREGVRESVWLKKGDHSTARRLVRVHEVRNVVTMDIDRSQRE